MECNKYIINFKANDLNYIDPNLDCILDDIQRETRRNESFEFEIIALFDECIITKKITNIVDTFIKDMMTKDYFFYYKNNKINNYVKEFILNLNSAKSHNLYYDDNYYQMEGFYLFSRHHILFYIPKKFISENKYNEYLGLGPDYMLAAFTPDIIFKYFIPYLYLDLYESNLLNDKEHKDLAKYQVGLH